MVDALETLSVWKRSRVLAVNVYKLFAHCKDYGFKDQITRAALSIPSNIAEGFERNSRKEFVYFLKIAKGSCAELRTQLYISGDINLTDSERTQSYITESLEISMMLQGLINRYKIKDNS